MRRLRCTLVRLVSIAHKSATWGRARTRRPPHLDTELRKLLQTRDSDS